MTREASAPLIRQKIKMFPLHFPHCFNLFVVWLKWLAMLINLHFLFLSVCKSACGMNITLLKQIPSFGVVTMVMESVRLHVSSKSPTAVQFGWDLVAAKGVTYGSHHFLAHQTSTQSGPVPTAVQHLHFHWAILMGPKYTALPRGNYMMFNQY